MKLIVFNQGLGDCINYASLVAQFAAKDRVRIACKKRPGRLYKKNVESFFAGLNVRVTECENNDQVRELMKLHSDVLALEEFSSIPYTFPDRHRNHVRDGYREAGLIWEDRQKYCPIASATADAIQISLSRFWDQHWIGNEYAFIPEGGEEGKFSIDRKYVGVKNIIKPPQDALMLEWANIIYRAAEIHCHDTSWPWLIDKLPTTGKLFFHKSRTFEGQQLCFDYEFLKPWEIIEYGPQAQRYKIMQRGRML